MKKKRISHLLSAKQRQEKLAMLTAYDASFAAQMSEAGLDILLVGDSHATVLGGQANELSATLESTCYHVRQVANGAAGPFIIGDLPFMSYATPLQAFDSARQVMAAGAEMVKMEGGSWLYDTVADLHARGVPVCVHLGLTPQSIHKLSGHKIQGRDAVAAQQLLQTALAFESAGASMLVIECVPHTLAAQITEQVRIPVIGIGAGPDCDGQVLVCYDMLGITPNLQLTFTQDFLTGFDHGVQGAFKAYVAAVKSGTFPTLAQSFT